MGKKPKGRITGIYVRHAKTKEAYAYVSWQYNDDTEASLKKRAQEVLSRHKGCVLEIITGEN